VHHCITRFSLYYLGKKCEKEITGIRTGDARVVLLNCIPARTSVDIIVILQTSDIMDF